MSAKNGKARTREEIAEELMSLENPAVIAIDGRCACGKTTLAEYLCSVTGAAAAHTDDFYLPAQLRTAKRLSAPGGNVHFERISAEVLTPFREGERKLCYLKYDCASGKSSPVTLAVRNLLIVEGTYSMHPALSSFYSLKIIAHSDYKKRVNRLETRCPEKLDDFLKKWIPLEDEYFERLEIENQADLLYLT